MTEDRIKWHLNVPVCRTLGGLKIHLAAISLAERWKLIYAFGAGDLKRLIKKMWATIKGRLNNE